MIKLRNLSTGLYHDFEITKFPDGTSQVWKIKDLDLLARYEVLWMFENEAELIHVVQLAQLLHNATDDATSIDLNMPYLVYGRQDKKIQNDSTFARSIVLNILGQHFAHIKTFDAHSYDPRILSQSPQAFFKQVFNQQLICYPDAGSLNRYKTLFTAPSLEFYKIRNQSTGEILDTNLIENEYVHLIKGGTILIIDDLIDGGGTFVPIVKELLKRGAKQVDIAASHGLFSKGPEVLYDAGITNIYTTNSLLRNKANNGSFWYNPAKGYDAENKRGFNVMDVLPPTPQPKPEEIVMTEEMRRFERKML